MLLALTAALALTPSPQSTQQGVNTWQFVSTADFSTPQRRHECGGTNATGDFLLLGGRGFRVVDRYDPIANVWTKGDFSPLEIHHFQPVERNGLVWIIGAFTGPFPNETPLPEIRLYEPATDTWSIGPTIPAARRRGSAGVVLYEDDFYVLGGNTLGHNGGFVPWFDRYDPDTDTWTELPDAPHARDHFSAVVIGNKLYAAAGRQSQLPQVQANTLPIVDVFDFESGQWSTVPTPIPTERAGVVSVGFGEHLVVAGGESATQAHAEVEALDVLTQQWIALPDLIQGRHGAAGALLGSELHVTAGVPNLGGSPELNTHERIDLALVLTPSAGNLLENPEFDTNVAGWSGGAFASAGSIAGGSLEVVGTTASQTVVASDLTNYRLRGVYDLSGAGSGTVRIEALDLA
ncbi:MAG: kelch repeat-containing protein, partial [Planctomycetota bacterium]